MNTRRWWIPTHFHRGVDEPAARGLGCTPEMKDPTPAAPTLLPARSMGEEATMEQLDWGSIEDEDGAFGQLSAAGRLQTPDPVASGASELPTPERGQAMADRELGDVAGGLVAINPLPQPGSADIDAPSLADSSIESEGIHDAGGVNWCGRGG